VPGSSATVATNRYGAAPSLAVGPVTQGRITLAAVTGLPERGRRAIVESPSPDEQSRRSSAASRGWALDIAATAILTAIAAISAARHSLWR